MNEETETKVEAEAPKKTYQCPLCDYPPFASEGGLRYHTTAKHGINSGPGGAAKCPECEYTSTAQGIALHRRLKHGVMGEFSKEKLTGKYRYKSKAGKLGCSYCDFRSDTKSGLTRHLRNQHPNETGYARIGEPVTKIHWPLKIERDTTMRNKVLEMVAEKIYNKLMEEL